MNPQFLDLLACPTCGGSLALVGDELRCDRAGEHWTIERGVPRLVPPGLSELESRTADAFGAEWTHFTDQHPEFEDQFLDWIHPLEPAFFRDKLVLDAGCGTGRHSFFAAKYGARGVVALDLSTAVETAREVLRPFETVQVVQGDLLRPPLRLPEDGGGFDLIYSIGVLHHLPDPQAGFQSLVRYLRPGGTIAVWVYGWENNGFVRNVVEPMRRGTTRLSPAALRTIAWPFAVGFHGAARGVYKPLVRGGHGRSLPLRDYVANQADFSFRQNYAIVYDQLAAPAAAYIRGDELREWFERAGLENVQLSHRHRNSWRGLGTRPRA